MPSAIPPSRQPLSARCAVDYPAMLDLLASGALQPELLVTRRVGLDDAGAAMAAMDAPTGPGMTIIEPARAG
jgi:alcohol dehydrogenase